MDLTQLLLSATSADQNILSQAVAALKQLEAADFAQYALSLSAEMSIEGKPTEARQLAGLLLKNALSAKDQSRKAEHSLRWQSLNGEVKSRVRFTLLNLLASNVKDVRSTASLCIANVAMIDLPERQWPELIPALTSAVENRNAPLAVRQASFECLGYICEEVAVDNSQVLQEQSCAILTAIAAGMRVDEPSVDIRFAATTALANSLEFVRDNMARKEERELIMSMVFGSSQCEDERVRVAALQCLVQIASAYYKWLEPFMQSVFTLTYGAMMQETEDVQLQAIEFWSTCCDQEISLMYEEREAEHCGEHEKQAELAAQNKHYVVSALGTLVPRLLDLLTHQQSEDPGDDTWSPAQAAAACLSLCAQAAKDPIVPPVLDFVQRHIADDRWRFKEAATIAFGCILDGPSLEGIRHLVSQALPVLLHNMQDKHELVKDTAAWTVGRVCNLVPETTMAMLDTLISALLVALNDVPSVAANACWAIHNLCLACVNEQEASSNILTKYFRALMERLLICSARPDAEKHSLMSSTYEAINALISSAAGDTFGDVQMLLTPLLKKLELTLQTVPISMAERERQNEVQGLLCTSLLTITQKLDLAFIASHADALMTCYIRVLDSKSVTVHEEALLAIGALANRLSEHFEKFVAALKPYLVRGLENFREYKVCITAVGLVGDVARALDKKFQPLGDEFMTLLLVHLQSDSIERSVKPAVISCLGDIALAVGAYFQRYLQFVHRLLIPASQLQCKNEFENYEDEDYLDSLRNSILEAWSAIIQGLAADNAQDAFLAPVLDPAGSQVIGQPLDHILNFFKMLAAQREKSLTDDILKGVCSVLGDLASIYGSKIRPALIESSVQEAIAVLLHLATDAVDSEEVDQMLADQVKWAKDELAKLDVLSIDIH